MWYTRHQQLRIDTHTRVQVGERVGHLGHLRVLGGGGPGREAERREGGGGWGGGEVWREEGKRHYKVLH